MKNEFPMPKEDFERELRSRYDELIGDLVSEYGSWEMVDEMDKAYALALFRVRSGQAEEDDENSVVDDFDRELQEQLVEAAERNADMYGER